VTVGSGLFFRLAYRLGFKPWDSGVPPPELVQVIEGERRLRAGRALDLGCGTGTTAVYMASHGWEVSGIDFVPQAIRTARARSAKAGLPVAFLIGDVTRLADLPIATGFDLVFDQGCFHSLPERAQQPYADGVARMARPGATYLLYAFGRQPAERRRAFFPVGVAPDDVRAIFGAFDLVEALPGREPIGSHWYTLRRR
jgi:SAM-dependent methyltransferase